MPDPKPQPSGTPFLSVQARRQYRDLNQIMATVFMRNVEPHFWAELKGACPSNVGTWASSESEGGGVLCWNISDLYIFTHIYIYKDKADIHCICAFLLVTCNLRFRCTVLEVDAGNLTSSQICQASTLRGFCECQVSLTCTGLKKSFHSAYYRGLSPLKTWGMLYHSYSKEP